MRMSKRHIDTKKVITYNKDRKRGVKNMTKDVRTRFTLRLPNELLRKLQEEALEKGCSTNSLVLKILWDWAKEKEISE